MLKQYLTAPVAEWKFAAGDSSMEFEGYGSVFGNVDSYGDVVAPGAFAATLRDAKSSDIWPAMLSQHGGMGLTAQDMTPVGVYATLDEDNIGLKVKGTLADTPRGQELYKLMKMKPRPAINGLSIGYTPVEWTVRSKPEEPRRTLKQVKLWEVSLVTFPANSKARVTDVKSAAPSEIERLLRDALGLSRQEAKALMAEGFRGLQRLRDAGEDATELADAIRQNINTLAGV